AFPTWLAPVQAMVLCITDKQRDYAEAVTAQLKAAGYRAEADLRNEKIGFKIREAEKAKIPFMLVVGDREMQAGTVSVRGRSGANLGSLSVPAVIDLIRADVSQALRAQ
ncbi:MAG: threonine--tRNA ligase, partial [Nitrospirae bacterium]